MRLTCDWDRMTRFIDVASSSDVISSTVAGVLQEYFKTPERTVFWDDTLKANVDPFPSMPGGFFAADWDMKVRLSEFRSSRAALHRHYLSYSSRYYASWWSCSSAIVNRLKRPSTVPGALYITSTRRSKCRLYPLPPATPRVKNGCN